MRCLAFEKAYDRVNWDNILRILKRIHCGSANFAWVRLLYTDLEQGS